MSGKSAGKFNPDGNVTIAEGAVAAARIHNLWREGDGSFPSSTPWYQSAVDYAVRNSIMTQGQFSSFTAAITRAQLADPLAQVLPKKDYAPINSVKSPPDVNDNTPGAASIFKLYNAGIVSGIDTYGTFAPFSHITRGAAAAIVSRMVNESLRKTVSLDTSHFTAVPMKWLANLKNIQKGASDAELAEAYNAALAIVTPYAGMSREEQLYGIASKLRQLAEDGMEYSTSAAHYNDPYGYFVLGVASCVGCTRAVGLCLNILGILYEHVNEDQAGHQ